MSEARPDPDATERIPLPPDSTLHALAPGQRLFGRYTLEAVAGRGGMGVVWRARDEELGEVVALKLLPDMVARDPVSLDELKEETRRARRLRHANIVGVYEFLRDDRHAAISMEFVDGATLSQSRLQQPGKVYSAEQLAPLVAQLCAALDYAHAEVKVAHRDLKPANLLVTRDGRLKIADFGIARSLSETHTRLTGSTTGGTSGTLLYMSPEQLLGKKTAVSDDVYAIGATLYELLTGKPPFYTGDITHQVLHVVPTSVSARRAELGASLAPLPLSWEQAVMACLEKDAARRPASAGEIARVLARPSRPVVAAPTAVKTEISSVRYDTKSKSSKTPLKVEPVAPGSSARYGEGPRKTGFIWPVVTLIVLGGLAAAVYRFALKPAAETNAAPPPAAAPVARAAEVLKPMLEPQSPDAGRGGLLVTAAPEGAEVVVQGFAPGKSPLTLNGIVAGRHPVVVRLAGYEEQKLEAVVRPDKVTPLEVTLVRSSGTVQLNTTPPGTAFVLTGSERTERGLTPAKLERVPIGDYTVTFQRPDWPEQRQTVRVARQQTATAQAEFRGGALEITSVPARAEVFLGGRRVGVTPLTVEDLRPGAVQVEARLAGFRTATASAIVAANHTAHTALTLTMQPLRIDDLALELVPIAPGTFTMGSESGYVDEKPLTQVTLTQPYWLGRTEVTQEQWRAIMGGANARLRADNLPVVNVSWPMATDFCRKLTERERAAGRLPAGYVYTLPTEAQWEYACRAGITASYAGEVDELGWFDRNSEGAAHPVAQKRPNAWGLHDMHGNVWEWCADWKWPYAGGSVRDPRGPATGTDRVIRGGSWDNIARNCRSSVRFVEAPGARNSSLGFRVALAPETTP